MDVCVRVGRRVEREEQSCEAAKASYKYKCPQHQTPTKRPPPRERRAGCTLSFPTCRHVNPHISVPPFRVYYSPLSLSLSQFFFFKKKKQKIIIDVLLQLPCILSPRHSKYACITLDLVVDQISTNIVLINIC